MKHKNKMSSALRALVQVEKVGGHVTSVPSPEPCELSLALKWFKVERRAHYPRVLKVVVGPKG